MSNYDITVLALLFIIAFVKCSEFLINPKFTFTTMLVAILMISFSIGIFLILFKLTSP
jgi:hypothetical protein